MYAWTCRLLLRSGDNIYTVCGTTAKYARSDRLTLPYREVWLYNSTSLDTNNDGNPDGEDEICADLPFITHDKTECGNKRPPTGWFL